MFIDYNSLHAAVDSRIGKRAYADEVILDMIAELQRHVARDFGCEVGYCKAFADFSQLGDHAGHIQRELAHNGIEPRFVPATIQDNAGENVLNFEVGRLVGSASSESTVVILTGTRVYHVLANALAQLGKQVIVLPVGMDGEVSDRDVHSMVRYVSASLLLNDALKRVLGGAEGEDGMEGFEVETAASSREDVTYEQVEDVASKQTLEVVERYFGQYDEVYLTPLLRKLSEEFGEHDYDPKTVISRLEEAGAVWLEKRRGFPYDYTVLILDSQHPDVKSIRQSVHPDSDWEKGPESDSGNHEDGNPEADFDDVEPLHAGTSHPEGDTV
ncbi:MAG: hypothetical protein KJO98_02405 [Rhodothermia bacterium]|nr:hypothetical protein [Rhodothermia bacterium]